jgi:thiol-disulfide isomerase/thioredoxin
MPSVNGSAIKLANYSGKVVLVNLWATWCGPCRLETPELVKLHQEYRSKGLEMVGLSTENPEASAEMVRDFVRQYNVDYPIGWATREVALSFMRLSGRNAIPQSFIIAADGRVLNQFVGFNALQTPDELRQAIEAALTANKAD